MKKDSRGKRNSGFPDGSDPPPANPGVYRFWSASGTLESGGAAGQRACVGRFEGSDGAVSVDIVQVGGGAVVNTDYTTTGGQTRQWSSGKEGDPDLTSGCLTIQAASGLSENKTAVFGFSNATGGIQAGETNQTFTLTLTAEAVEPPPEVPAATMFVAQNGSDSSGNGSTGSPYATIAKAIAEASDGEVIEIRTTTPGATWTYTEGTTTTRRFSATNPITIRVRAGDTVLIQPTTQVAIFRFSTSLSNKARGITLDGTVGTLHLGNPALWTPDNGGTATYPHAAGLQALHGGDNLKFKGLRVSGAVNYNASIFGELPDAVIGPLWFEDCQFLHHGRESPTSNRGNGLALYQFSELVLLNCRFGPWGGGHNVLQLRAIPGPSVIKGCSVEGFLFPDGTGYRAGAFSPAHGVETKTPNLPSGTGRMLVDKTILRDVGKSARATYTAGAKLSGNRLIYRRGLAFDIYAGCVMVIEKYSVTAPNMIQHQRVYHNTFHDVFNIVKQDAGNAGEWDATQFADTRFLNNIFSNVTNRNHRNGTDTGGWSNVAAIWLNRMGIVPLEGYPNHWKGMVWDGNLFHTLNGGLQVQLNNSSGTVGSGRAETLAQAKSLWPAVFLASNQVAQPIFTDAAARTFAGFALAEGSPGIGEAVPLATVSSGSSGTTVTLSDAYWIYDGVVSGIPADHIAFYASDGTTLKGIRQAVEVISQTQVQIDSAITLTAGDHVYLVDDDGTTVHRNVGAL